MTGLREDKKRRTRALIQSEGLRLIAVQGYDATTCAQIATAAGVSPATLFRYFATKEDIVLQDVYDPMIAEAVRARPPHESPLTAVRRGLATTLAAVYETDLEEIRQRTALVFSVPALLARSRDQQRSLVDALAGALAERLDLPRADIEVEVTATVLASALTVAVERWVRLGGELPAHVDEALSAVATVTRRPTR